MPVPPAGANTVWTCVQTWIDQYCRCSLSLVWRRPRNTQQQQQTGSLAQKRNIGRHTVNDLAVAKRKDAPFAEPAA